jgi:Helix-turn-helix
MTGPELNRLSGAVRFMELYSKRGLWWLHTNKGTARYTIAAIQKRITRLQVEHGLRPYNVTTFETRGGLHAHIVLIGNREVVERLKSSTAFGELVQVDPAPDPGSLARKYLAKERTPQAGYARQHVLGGRLRGSHRLDGGGDRVRLSRDLERDAIDAGYVEHWQHANARRSAGRKPYSPRLTQRLRKTAPRPGGQTPLFPEFERPVSRLREFGGGFVPPAVRVEIEWRRQQLGLTQDQLAAMIGRSQGQYANAIRGHDPISGIVVNRLRDILIPDRGVSSITSAITVA